MKCLCYLLLIVMTVFISNETLSAHDHIVNFQFAGVKYDSLYIFGPDINMKKIEIDGQRKGENHWSFAVPDSIYDILSAFEVTYKTTDWKKYITYFIRFNYLTKKDTVNFMALSLADEDMFLKARFLRRDTIKKFPFIIQENGKNTLTYGERITDEFQIIDTLSTDIAARIADPYFSAFWNGGEIHKTYEDYLKEYIEMSLKYPDSKYLMTNLSNYIMLYHSREDVAKVYNNLSDKYKLTYWGKRINEYIHEKVFDNIKLPSGETGVPETIIKDTTKYNLVIFSASWCTPCREEIPLLKKLFSDLHNKLNMVYVSVDEPNTVAEWKNLMQKERIPWRSVLAENDTKKIMRKYFVDGVPYTILVYPGGLMKKLDIRNASEWAQLYKLVRKIQNRE